MCSVQILVVRGNSGPSAFTLLYLQEVCLRAWYPEALGECAPELFVANNNAPRKWFRRWVARDVIQYLCLTVEIQIYNLNNLNVWTLSAE